MTLDLAPLVNQVLIPILASVLIAVVTWAAARVAKLAHFQIQDGQRKVIADAINNGLAYAEKTLAPSEKFDANAKVAAAVNYILPKVPGALKSLGVTPEHLTQIVTAKLPA